jgi:hypothetical protein
MKGVEKHKSKLNKKLNSKFQSKKYWDLEFKISVFF